ncbi:MAG: 50S ribosomal protein L3 N(5)-glutamine methyltransferase [Acidiferrobacterales bacterium]
MNERTDGITLRTYILQTEETFDRAKLHFGHGTADPLDEAAWLAGSALGINPDDLETFLDKALTGDELRLLDGLVCERIETRKPVAYLLNEAWFAGHRFFIDERALIPRSLIGEYIQEQFQPWVGMNSVHSVLDLCTGSGCIAIAMALEFPDASIDAVDISTDALAVANRNITDYALEDRVNLIQSDLFEMLGGRHYDLIISNPPYVPQSSMDLLPAEYNHEPTLALKADDNGLAIINTILENTSDYLNEEGLLIVEAGESREAVDEKYSDISFTWLAHESGEEAVFLLGKKDLESFR